jgi:hypothetical protein
MKTILIIICCGMIVLLLSDSKAEPARAMQAAIHLSVVDSLEF